MASEITTVQHPTSGDIYAVRIEDGVIAEAAGPLYHSDARDVDSLTGWLANNSTTAREDGAWLQGEIEQAS